MLSWYVPMGTANARICSFEKAEKLPFTRLILENTLIFQTIAFVKKPRRKSLPKFLPLNRRILAFRDFTVFWRYVNNFNSAQNRG